MLNSRVPPVSIANGSAGRMRRQPEGGQHQDPPTMNSTGAGLPAHLLRSCPSSYSARTGRVIRAPNRRRHDGCMTRVVDVVRAVVAPLTARAASVASRRCAPAVERFVARCRRRVQLSALLVPSLILHTWARSRASRATPAHVHADGRVARSSRAPTSRAAASGLDGEPARASGCRDHRPRTAAWPCAPTLDPRRRARCGLGAHRGAVAGLPQYERDSGRTVAAVPAAAGPLADGAGRAASGREQRRPCADARSATAPARR